MSNEKKAKMWNLVKNQNTYLHQIIYFDFQWILRGKIKNEKSQQASLHKKIDDQIEREEKMVQ